MTTAICDDMKNDTYLNIRVPKSELEAWKGTAADSGTLFSEWVREACEAYAAPESEVMPSATESVRPKSGQSIRAGVVTGEHRAVEKTSAKCKHGTEKGYRCWQCGGMAKVSE